MKKKTTVQIFCLALIMVVGVLSLTTCKIGLGPSVDIYPPKVLVEYPPQDVVIRGAFVMQGRASDDSAIQSITVRAVETNTDNPRTYNLGEATLNKNTETFEIWVNTPSETETNVLGDPLYPIVDGTYEFTLTATDEAGRKTDRRVIYTIDNTAPVAIILVPGTANTLSSGVGVCEAYGVNMRMQGSIHDANKLDALEISVFGENQQFISKKTITTVDSALEKNNNDSSGRC